jgi:hypothetical protein
MMKEQEIPAPSIVVNFKNIERMPMRREVVLTQ